MSTYADMQSRIADELVRPDLSAQIRLAIKSSIAFYESERFYFNEGRATINTRTGQEYYGLPSNFQKADALSVEISTNRWEPVELRAWAWMENQSRYTNYNGTPEYYAIFAGQLRLLPIPDDTYRIELGYAKSLPALVNDDDTNAWCDDGEEIIRLHAKVDLLANVIRGPEAIQEALFLKQLEGESAQRLRTETSRRLATGYVEPFL